MLQEEIELFQSAVKISEQRDLQSLHATVIQQLAKFIEFDTLILLNVPRCIDASYLEVSALEPKEHLLHEYQVLPHCQNTIKIKADQAILECFDTQKSNHNSSKRNLFPIIINHKIIGFLDIYGHTITAYSQKLIDGFIDLYKNFLSILNDNELDSLTGLLNRKTFKAKTTHLFTHQESPVFEHTSLEKRSLDNQNIHCVGMLDIDHFKQINDQFGHAYGDEVLITFAKLLKQTFRKTDLLFRYGGEEFIVVLTSTSKEHIQSIFDKFRSTIENHNFGELGKVTVSIGTVIISEEVHTLTALERADKALYYSKRNGRNQISDYHQLVNQGILSQTEIKNNIEIF